MSTVPRERRFSYQDYLAYERISELKHEFEDGEIIAMAGGSARHSALAFRVAIAIGNALPSGYTGFQSDMRVRVLAQIEQRILTCR